MEAQKMKEKVIGNERETNEKIKNKGEQYDNLNFQIKVIA